MRPANVRPRRYRHSRGHGNRASIPASRRPTPAPSSQTGETPALTLPVVRTLPQDWRRSISTPGGFGPPAQTARSAGVRGSPDGSPTTADRLAETPQALQTLEPTRSSDFSLPSVFLISRSLISDLRNPQLRCVA